jgi:hypothetical protein
VDILDDNQIIPASLMRPSYVLHFRNSGRIPGNFTVRLRLSLSERR